MINAQAHHCIHLFFQLVKLGNNITLTLSHTWAKVKEREPKWKVFLCKYEARTSVWSNKLKLLCHRKESWIIVIILLSVLEKGLAVV